ncbi:hypothetical protein STEG23_017294 [Scotinomys teguina]
MEAVACQRQRKHNVTTILEKELKGDASWLRRGPLATSSGCGGPRKALMILSLDLSLCSSLDTPPPSHHDSPTSIMKTASHKAQKSFLDTIEVNEFGRLVLINAWLFDDETRIANCLLI